MRNSDAWLLVIQDIWFWTKGFWPLVLWAVALSADSDGAARPRSDFAAFMYLSAIGVYFYLVYS